jgi:hypothetical protein
LTAAALLLALGLSGCAQVGRSARPFETGPHDPGWPHAALLLLGEQHDAPEHQHLSAQVVARLAGQGRLAAVALEMAEQGHRTDGLPRDASEVQVREALAWDAAGWPWSVYGPIAMAAVREGVPVVGANLPRTAMREAMRDATLDRLVGPAVRQQLQDDVRDGHCGLLPASQLAPMTRIQIARDRAMAQTLRSLAAPDRVVMLVAGAGHVDATRGVPRHLLDSGVGQHFKDSGMAEPLNDGEKAQHAQGDSPPPNDRRLSLRTVHLAAGAAPGARSAGFDETWPTPATPPVDHCAGLAGQLGTAR